MGVPSRHPNKREHEPAIFSHSGLMANRTCVSPRTATPGDGRGTRFTGGRRSRGVVAAVPHLTHGGGNKLRIRRGTRNAATLKQVTPSPTSAAGGEQMNLVGVMELKDGLIEHHRVYSGWRSVKVLEEDKYRRR